MSLKYKVIIITLVTFLFSFAIDYGIQRLVIMPNFHELERAEASKNITRVIEAINRELQLVSMAVCDWAYWDPMYQFATDRNTEFLDSTLNETALQNAHVNLMNVYDAGHSLVWGKAMDLDSDASLDLGIFSAERLPDGHPLINVSDVESEVTGVIDTPHGPMLIAAKPILTNERKGPASGTFVMGRFLNEAAVRQIGEQTRLSLSVLPHEAVEPVEPMTRPAGHSLPQTPIRLEIANNLTVAKTTIGDLSGQPLLTIRVATPRVMEARGEAAMHFALLSIGGAGLLLIIVLLLMLHRTIIRPIGQLTAHAIRVGESDDLRIRLGFRRKDEIGALGREFDSMTDRLAEARRRLVDQSYHSGIAEMASGVLHNIGNAITPMNVRLATLREELNDAPTAEMEMALGELSSDATDPGRREDLTKFVELAGSELASLVTRMEGEISTIAQQVSHVQQILSDQERYSRATRVLEPVNMEVITREASAMLAPEMQRTMAIQVSPSVSQVGDVLASRVVLQQLVTNLLVNAAESILTSESREGRLVVTGEKVKLDGAPCAHIRFEDNGQGITSEDLKRMFERSFSTKNRGSGLGLHWSANTVNALKGRLYAESEGPGKGLSMHLILPLAEGGDNGNDFAKDEDHGV
jgi:sensor domain CHASE-containing protein